MNYDAVFEEIVLKAKKEVTGQKALAHQTLVHHATYTGYNRLKDPAGLGGRLISLVPEKKDVSLEEAIKDAQDNVLRHAEGKRVFLLLSGGIDSTLAFYALLQTGIPFTVVSDDMAIREYPKLYQKILHNEFKNVSFYASMNHSFIDLANDKKVLIVTGEIGDQVMGSMVNMKFSYEERNMSLEKAIERDLLHKICVGEYKGNFTMACVDEYGDLLQWLGKPAANCTVAEFLWSLNFIYKYLLVIYRLYMCGMVQYGDGKNTCHFFDTEKFQQYSMSHYEENCAYKEDYEYKQAFKDWIYLQNGDEEFRKWKLKVPSLKLATYWRERLKI